MTATAAVNASVVKDRWSLVTVAGMLSFVAMLDMNIVNIAMPALSRSLHISPEAAQWVALGYQLPVVALLLPAGRWLDQVGTRPALILAVCGFTSFSAAAAIAPSAAWLFAARFVQGSFGALLFVLMPVLAARSVRPESRGRAMSVPATLGPLGAVTGPAVGGILLDHLGWRAVFLVKIPICLAALVIACRSVPAGGRLRLPDRRTLGEAGLVGTAVAAVLLALTFAPSSPVWLLFGVSAVPPLVHWLRGETGRATTTVLAAGGGAHGAVLCVAAGFAVVRYLVALHLQEKDGVSATVAGLSLLAFPLGMALAGPLGGWLADRFPPRRVALGGSGITAFGLLLLVPLGDSWTPSEVAWRLGLAGLGMGLYGGPVQKLVMTAAPPGRTAAAGSAVQLARSLGFTLGPALAVAAWGLAGRGTGGIRGGLTLAAALAGVAVLLLAARPERHLNSEKDSR